MKSTILSSVLGLALGASLLAGQAFAEQVAWAKSSLQRTGAGSLVSATATSGGSNVDTTMNLIAWISSTVPSTTNIILTGVNGQTLETRTISTTTTPVSMTFVRPLPFTGIRISPTQLNGTDRMHIQLLQSKL